MGEQCYKYKVEVFFLVSLIENFVFFVFHIVN